MEISSPDLATTGWFVWRLMQHRIGYVYHYADLTKDPSRSKYLVASLNPNGTISRMINIRSGEALIWELYDRSNYSLDYGWRMNEELYAASKLELVLYGIPYENS